MDWFAGEMERLGIVIYTEDAIPSRQIWYGTFQEVRFYPRGAYLPTYIPSNYFELVDRERLPLAPTMTPSRRDVLVVRRDKKAKTQLAMCIDVSKPGCLTEWANSPEGTQKDLLKHKETLLTVCGFNTAFDPFDYDDEEDVEDDDLKAMPSNASTFENFKSTQGNDSSSESVTTAAASTALYSKVVGVARNESKLAHDNAEVTGGMGGAVPEANPPTIASSSMMAQFCSCLIQ